jgi:hypothetical protein
METEFKVLTVTLVLEEMLTHKTYPQAQKNNPTIGSATH